MGSIRSEEARQWLENILITSQNASSRKSALNALEKIGDTRAQGAIVETLSREQDQKVLEAAAYSLAKIAPSNSDVQQSMIAKFYEVSDENIKRNIMNAIGTMAVTSQNEFFVRIAVDSQYSTPVRLEAIDALINDSVGNSSDYVSEISVLAASEDEELQAKVQEALEYLSDG